MHSRAFDELVLLADAGELPAAAAGRLAAHEPGCGECAALRAALAAGRRAAAAAAVSLPERRLRDLARGVRGDAPAREERTPVPWLPRLLGAGALAAAAALVLRLGPGAAVESERGLARDLARLDAQVSALERALALEEPLADIDAELGALRRDAERLSREM